MNLSDLQVKQIVNIKDGKNIGKIVDAIINDEGKILSFIVQRTKLPITLNKNETEIKWNQIKKIGADVILIDFI